MKTEEVRRTLHEVADLLGGLEEVRTILLETPLPALTDAIEAIREGWRLGYESHATMDGTDYDDHWGTETWCLSGSRLPEPKYWYGEWDHRSREGGPSAKEVLEAGQISSVRGRSKPKYAEDVMRALMALTAIFPKEN